MNNELGIEQPLPDQFSDNDVGGGCNAAPVLGGILVVIILVVLFIAIIKNK